MSLTDKDLAKIARYLFLHKWLAASYSPLLEQQLIKELKEAIEEDDTTTGTTTNR